jgi:vitamin B12 transporter
VLASTLAASAAFVALQSAGDDTLLVRGTRLDQLTRDAGTAVTVITAEDIRQLGTVFLADVLASVPGLTLNRAGSFGGAASVRLRGASSGQTLVLIDGVPAGDPSSPNGGSDIARLDAATIERIEVLRGPQATLWGSEAIGGVILITTKRPQAGVSATAFAEAGSFSLARGGGSVAFSEGPVSGRIGGTLISVDGPSKADRSQGNDETDPYRAANLQGALTYAFPGGGEATLSYLLSDAETEFDGFDAAAPGFTSDTDDIAFTEEEVASLAVTRPAFGGRLANQLVLGRTIIERENRLDGTTTFETRGERLTARYQGTVEATGAVTLAFGAEADNREADGEETTIASGFLLGELKPLPRLTLSAGLRLDTIEDGEDETSARLAAAYRLGTAITARASYGEGFKAPTLFQTTFACCGASEPNRDLAPERSTGTELGIRVEAPRLVADISVFHLDTENLIDFTGGRYVNIAEAESRGFEFEASLDLLSWLDVSTSYAFIEAEDGEGNRLPRVPRHSGDATFSVTPQGPISGTLTIRHNGRESDPFGEVDAWTRLDLSAIYTLTDRIELYARVENLTNRSYQEVLGYGTPERSGRVGVRLAL